MKILVLDVENSVTHKRFTKRDGKVDKYIDMTPYNENNFLVSVGYNENPSDRPDHSEYLFFKHNGREATPGAFETLQKELDDCDLLVGHNIKHDLAWLIECGFKYDGPLYDTMIAEFVLARGTTVSLSLEDTAERYACPVKKSHLTKEYLDKGIGFEDIPPEIVEEYGRGDVVTTTHLYLAQTDTFRLEKNQCLLPTVRMMCAFTHVLREMESNGIYIDFERLDEVEAEYLKEQAEIKQRLHEIAQKYMGDTPIELTKPEFLSKLFYSRKVMDKKKWKEVFNIGTDKNGKNLRRPYYKTTQFNKVVKSLTKVVSKTEVQKCKHCDGKGYINKFTKAGVPYKKMPKCSVCGTAGVIYKPIGVKAGFGIHPKGVSDVAKDGFVTNKNVLETLLESTKGDVHEFIEGFIRYNAISSYLSTFIDGIRKHVQSDGRLHPHYNQCVARTGRLSCTAPNLMNQPRGKTFPIREVFVSRWKGGKIGKPDYGQLEFRIAGYLSGCPQVLKDVLDKIDVHARTRDIINNFDLNLTQIDRQDAKPDTFKPLYGGLSGTPRQAAYYSEFLKRYYGVAKWQDQLKQKALKKEYIRLPSGREYFFPYAKRTQGGYVKESTKIVNYPVQGFATADLVPLGGIAILRLFAAHGLSSKLCLTTHDDFCADIYPGEEDIVTKLMIQGMLSLPEMCKEFYGIDFEYPIEVEMNIGDNMGKVETVACEERK